ncbi:MAG: hypothetical protein ACI9Y1_003101 [Lentisphaeria bacterium]|jgi:hypothetical protein
MRAIQKVINVSRGEIQGVLKQATALQLTWERVRSLNEKQLTELFYPAQKSLPATFYELPDWSEAHRELSRKGMTQQLLWEEYAEQHTDGCYSYSRYCRLYNAWAKKNALYDKFTKPVKNVLWIMQDKRYPLSARQPVNLLVVKFLSPCSVH